MTSTCAPLSALAGSSSKVAPEDDHLRHARTADVGLKGARTARRDKLSNCGALMRFFLWTFAQQFCSNEKIEMIHFEVERAFSA